MSTKTEPVLLPVDSLKLQFCEFTLYSEGGILAWNPHTRLFYTLNGGLYRLLDGGVEHLEGPSPDPEERL